MAHSASKLARATAGLLAQVLLVALLAPAPGRAAPGGASDAPAREIGAGTAGCVGAVPSAPERSRVAAEAGLVSLLFCGEAAARAPAVRRPTRLVGGAPPALVRWRLAHGTATSSP